MAFQDVTPGFGSASTNGKMIAIAATSTPGTLLHTHAGGTTTIDSITLYAVSVSASNVALTIEFGGTATADTIPVTLVPGVGMVMVVRGGRLNNGLSVRAFANSANNVNIKVEVDTIELQ